MLEPKEDSIQIDSPSVITQDIPSKKIQVYQKYYQINFVKNAYAVEAETLQKILNKLKFLEEKDWNYHLFLTGHTDDDGSLEANEKLSKQRVEAVPSWFLERNINTKQITIAYKG